MLSAKSSVVAGYSNSSKHIGPVVELDGKPVGDGLVGPVWEKAMTVYEAAKYDF